MDAPSGRFPSSLERPEGSCCLEGAMDDVIYLSMANMFACYFAAVETVGGSGSGVGKATLMPRRRATGDAKVLVITWSRPKLIWE